MAEYKLGRIRFVWKNNWTTGTTYVKDDIVRYGGKTYACVVGHVADTDFYTDLDNIPARWNQVSDGSEWKGDWTTSTYYKVNDLVKYGGRVYLCNEGHESNASANSGTSPDTTAGLEADFTKWDLYASSLDWKGDWATSTRYKIDDVVRYGGISYVCNTGHQSSATATSDADGLEADLSKWDQYATGFSWIGDWSANYRYKKNDVVLYGGTTYVCNTGHKSAASVSLGLEDDQGLWDYFHKGIEFLGDWSPSSVRYKVNDIVKFGSDLWICVTPHTSSSTFAEINWSLFVNGLEYENSWSNAGVYQPGDVVSYGGYAYISKTNNTNVIPTSSISDWDLFTTGFSFQGDWTTATEYKVGQVVRLNGYTYVALEDHTAGAGTIPPNGTYWSRLNSGIKWAASPQLYANVSGTNVLGTGSGATFDVTLANTKYTAVIHVGSEGTGYSTNDVVKITGDLLGGVTPANDLLLTVTASGGAIQSVAANGFSVTWASGTAYVLGDSVAFGVNTYICIQAHVGATLNRPDNDTTGSYWNLLAVGSITSILTTQGDTLYYGGAGPTRLPIGTDGQVLRVVGDKPAWTYFGVINNVVYVANSGADVIGNGQGLTIDKPWKSVRFAAKQIEDGYLNPNATELLRKNKQFIIEEAKNFVSQEFKVVVSAATATDFLTTDTSGIYVNMPISFTGTVGGVVAGTTYYVHSVVANTSFRVSNTLGGGARSLSAGAGAMTGTFVFSTRSTEHDAGIIVDAVAFDLSHSGTLQTTTAALAYFNAAGNDYVTGVNDYDILAFTGTLEYVKTLIENVLNNNPPAQNFQDLNGVLLENQAIQVIDVALTSEANATVITSNLVDIVITGLEAGTTSAIPAVINPGTTISVKTGTYSEILPIVVPRNTAIVGDELRSSVVQPAAANTNLVNDKPKTISVLNRIKSVIPDLIANNAVTPTSGNLEAQQYLNGFVGSTTAISRIDANTDTINTILAGGLGVVPVPTITDPSGYDTGYFNARRLIVANKAFLQDEVTAFMNTNYNSVWSSLTVGQQAACTRDISYIVDALQYDLTYGGNLETVVAARSYYSNGTFVENEVEKTAAIAVQQHLSDIIGYIATGDNTSWTRSVGNFTLQDVSGTAGSSAAGLFASDRITEIKNTISSGYEPTVILPSLSWVSSTLVEAASTIQIKKSAIQSGAIAAINKMYPTLVYNEETCARDVGYIIDALCYDFMFNSNFRSIKAAMAYYRATASAEVVINDQLTQTEFVVNYVDTALQHLVQGVTGDAGSSAAVSAVLGSAGTVAEIVANGIGSLPDFAFTEYTGYNTSILIGYGDAKDQLLLNKTFIVNEITEWIADQVAGSIAPFSAGFTYDSASCEADVGYIIDALIYDLTYGGNYQTRVAANAYFSNGAGVYGAGEKDEVIAAYNHLADVVGYVITENTSWTKSTALVQNTGGTAGSAESSTFAQARIDEIIATITSGGTSPSVLAYPTYTFSSDLQNAFNALIAAKSEIQSDTVAWVNKFYQSMNFDSDLCSRDAGLIVEAIAYDVLFGTNFNSIKAGMAYHRATAQEVLDSQLSAEIGAINFIAQKAKRIAAYGSAAQAVETINDIIETIAGVITITATDTVVGGNIIVSSTTGIYTGLPVKFTGSLGMIVANQQYWIHSIIDATTIRITNTYGGNAMTNVDASGSITGTVGGNVETCGTNEYNNVLATINGAEILRINKSFLSNEATAWVNASFGGTVTNTTSGTNEFTTSSAHNLTVGDPVKFTGASLFGNVTSGTTYYVLTVPTTTTFTLTPIQGSSTVFEVVTASGSMIVSYSFDEAACKRDMAAYIDALIYDINYLGNYKSIRAATLYNHAVAGSALSDMFYLRNGTGLRNMTLSGLSGVLGTANAYGTQRPTAGAYASLDPGYGPTDSNVWITPRSPYVQNVTTFGTGCVGCKIDGALHSAGNRSIVSNDFTQILSDGIGVWCTGSNALTELVSVFTYYNYSGYLAELGGKIRATNGNNSYGTYGSLAEGVDTYEVPITATVNNRYYEAQVGLVVTDGVDTVSRLEFTNAGSNYNSATYSISGTGYNVEVDTYTPEFRDGGVFEGRILSTGADHASIANVAQGGTATSITIAATDSAISAAYVGMRIIITSGTGAGQTGYFLTYNSGTKAGTIGKESFTPLAIQSTSSVTFTVADATTLYENMRVQLVGTLLTGMSGVAVGTNYYVVNISGNTFSLSTGVGGTAITVGTGSGGGPLELHAVGWDHIIPGTSIVSALDLTTAYIIEPRVKFTSPAYTATEGTIVAGSYFNLVYGDTINTYNGAGSVGVAATGGTGTNATFTVVRTGVSYSVTSNNPGTGYSYGDVLTILGTNLGGTTPTNNLTITVNDVNTSTGAIQNFTYTGVGIGGYFVALPENGTSTAISTTGSSFVSGGSRTNNVFWNAMAYGAGRWVAISAGNACEYTDDPTAAWTVGGNMPSSGGWSGLAYGGVFVAVRSSSTSTAYSANGTSWTAGGTLPAIGAWTGLAYGNGVYVTLNSGTNQAASSGDNGVSWVSRTLPATLGWVSITFGKGLFVAVANGSSEFAYSKDGINWTLSTNNGLGTASWQKVVYGAGVFCATASSSNIIATSDDGINWKQRSLTTTFNWYQVAYGNPNSSPVWVVLSSANTSVTNYLNLGCTAQGRVKVTNGEISEFRVVEPGSGYPSAPTIQIIDPNQTASATWQIRSGNGVLASPNFKNRGLQYATAIATVEGNGYADQYQTGYFINVQGLLEQPTPGSNIQIDLNGNYYKLVQVTNYLGTQGNGAGGSSPYTARFQLSPDLVAGNAPAHGTGITLRLKYSQVRLTGHDFLSIGTGNVTTTNYPDTPLQLPDPSKETVGNGGGRVFYTSTDQDGNFRVGTLFSVEQATGVASINADAFNLAGLNSLTLGSVALGGTGATITQFSTDQYFTANSDNIVPTQKAIKAYIASQIGGGSSALNVNTLTAGVIYIAGNSISTTTGVQINVSATMNFTGGINGLPVAMDFLLLG